MEPYAAHSRGGTVPSGSSEPDGFGMVLIPASSVTPWLREDHIGVWGAISGPPIWLEPRPLADEREEAQPHQHHEREPDPRPAIAPRRRHAGAEHRRAQRHAQRGNGEPEPDRGAGRAR